MDKLFCLCISNRHGIYSKVVATETSLPGVTLGHLAMAEKQYLGLTFLQVIVVLVVRAVMMVMAVKAAVLRTT